MDGFKGEVQHGVESTFKSVAKLTGGIIAIGGVSEFAKSIVEAATENQAAFDVLRGTIKNAGADMRVFGGEVEEVIAKEARLKGFSDDQLASSMVRLVSATGDTKKAFKDLVLAEDLARARHIDVATAALALSKAEQGSFTALQRYGIVVKGAAGETEKLRAAHDKAVASGATFTASQKQAYAAALAAAGAADKQAKSQAAIAAVEQRFGGAGSTYAKTAAGQFARLREDVHQFEESLGNVVVPTLATAAEGLGHLIEGLTESGQAARAFKSAEQPVVEGLKELGDIAQVVAPPLLEIAGAAAQVVKVIGPGPILAAVAAYKAIGITQGIATKVQLAYGKAVAAGVAAEKAIILTEDGKTVATTRGAIAAAEAATAARANTTATLQASAAAKGFGVTESGLLIPMNEVTIAYVEQAAAARALMAVEAENTAVAGASAAAATRLGRAGQAGKGLMALGAGAAGGPLVLGLTAAAAGIYYLTTRQSEWDKANSSTTKNLGSLTEAINRAKDATANLAAAERSAKNGSENAGDLTAARNEAAQAADEQDAAFKKTADSIADMASTTAKGSKIVASWGKTWDGVTAAEEKASEARGQSISAAKQFTTAIAKQSEGLKDSNPLLYHNIGLLEQLTTRLKNVPSRTQIELLINNKEPTAALQDILDASNLFSKNFAAAFERTHPNLYPKEKDTYSLPNYGGIATAIQNAAASTIEKQRTKAVSALEKQLAEITATGDAALAQQRADLARQEQQGRESIKQAVASAQQNVLSIGSSIAASITQVMDKPFQTQVQAITLAQDQIAAKYDRLSAELIPESNRLANENARAQLASDKLSLQKMREQVILPGGKSLSTDPDKALQQLRRLAGSANLMTRDAVKEFILQYSAGYRAIQGDKLGIRQNALSQGRSAREGGFQLRGDDLRVAQDHADIVKTAITRRVEDLTLAFESGRIKFATLSKELSNIMVKNDSGFKRAGKLLGAKFEAEFRAQVAGLGLQADALSKGPQRSGQLGLLPNIVKPADVVKQVLQDNAKAANALSKSTLEQNKKQTTLLGKIHHAQQGSKFTDSLSKNPGVQTKKSNDLVGSTG